MLFCCWLALGAGVLVGVCGHALRDLGALRVLIRVAEGFGVRVDFSSFVGVSVRLGEVFWVQGSGGGCVPSAPPPLYFKGFFI